MAAPDAPATGRCGKERRRKAVSSCVAVGQVISKVLRSYGGAHAHRRIQKQQPGDPQDLGSGSGAGAWDCGTAIARAVQMAHARVTLGTGVSGLSTAARRTVVVGLKACGSRPR